MHQYLRHIGDYYKKAGRLTMLQHGAYGLLMDACYDRECFPTLEQAIEWCWASTPEECQAVEFVLRRFFREGEGGIWVQKRIAEVVAEYHEFCEKQRINGKKGGRPKKPLGLDKKAMGSNKKPTGFSEKPKKTLTDNHKPITDTQPPHSPPEGGALELDGGESRDGDIDPADLFNQFWTDYPRKVGKKAAREAFLKHKPTQSFVDLLRHDIARRLGCGAWIDSLPDRNYIPHPATYLNGERWKDEVIPRGGGGVPSGGPGAGPRKTRDVPFAEFLTSPDWAN